MIGLHHVHTRTPQRWMSAVCPQRSSPPPSSQVRHLLLRESACLQRTLPAHRSRRAHRRWHAQRVCRVEGGTDPFTDAGMQRHLSDCVRRHFRGSAERRQFGPCCQAHLQRPALISEHHPGEQKVSHECCRSHEGCHATAEPRGSQRTEEPQFKPRPRPQPRLSDPAQTVAWGGTLPGGRRAVVGALSGLSIGDQLTSLDAAPVRMTQNSSLLSCGSVFAGRHCRRRALLRRQFDGEGHPALHSAVLCDHCTASGAILCVVLWSS